MSAVRCDRRNGRHQSAYRPREEADGKGRERGQRTDQQIDQGEVKPADRAALARSAARETGLPSPLTHP